MDYGINLTGDRGNDSRFQRDVWEFRVLTCNKLLIPNRSSNVSCKESVSVVQKLLPMIQEDAQSAIHRFLCCVPELCEVATRKERASSMATMHGK